MSTVTSEGAATGSAEQIEGRRQVRGIREVHRGHTVKNAKGELIDMNRNGIIALVDGQGREKDAIR